MIPPIAKTMQREKADVRRIWKFLIFALIMALAFLSDAQTQAVVREAMAEAYIAVPALIAGYGYYFLME